MKMMKFLKLSMWLGTLALVCPANAQDSPEDYVMAHNQARKAVGVGPLTWDDQVATFAENYAKQRSGDCSLVHSRGEGRYGESLAVGTGDLSGVEAVNLWVSEKNDYNYNSSTCAPNGVCRHYAQVVWCSSVRLGCAKVRCKNGGTFISCNYDPPSSYF